MSRRKWQATQAPILATKIEGDAGVTTPQSGVPQALVPLQLINWVPRKEGPSRVQQEIQSPVPIHKDETTNTAARRLNFPMAKPVPSPIKVNSGSEIPTMAYVVKNNRA